MQRNEKMRQSKGLKQIQSDTHIVLLLGSNCIDKVIFGHEQVAIFVLVRVAHEDGAGLVRQLGRLCAADESFLDGFLDARHCVTANRAVGRKGKSDREQPKGENPPHNKTGGRGGEKAREDLRWRTGTGLSQKGMMNPLIIISR